MPDLGMLIMVKDDDLKAAAKEDMRELIDAGEAGVMTFDEFGAFLVKLLKPRLDVIGEGIENVNKYIALLQGKPEAEADEEEIPDPPDMGEILAEAALKTWHDGGAGGQAQSPGYRKPVEKPDPPGLHTSEDPEEIPDPDPDSEGIIEAAKKTWKKGRGLFGGDD